MKFPADNPRRQDLHDGPASLSPDPTWISGSSVRFQALFGWKGRPPPSGSPGGTPRLGLVYSRGTAARLRDCPHRAGEDRFPEGTEQGAS